MYDAFVSHSSKDKDSFVRELYECLSKLGNNIWIDEDVILSGDNILDEIKKGISESLCVVLVLTEHFFRSNWTALEIGIATSNNQSKKIIPIFVDITESYIAEKLPFLLNTKYLRLNQNDISACANALNVTISKLRESKRIEDPLDYHEKVRQLNNFDSPITNRLSILITEYEQICKISKTTGIVHAIKIAETIIDDVTSRAKIIEKTTNLSYADKLELLMDKGNGINQNVREHLISVLQSSNSSTSTFFNDEDMKKMADLSLASILDWYLSYVSVFLKKNKSNESIDVVWSDELIEKDFTDMYEIDKLVLRPDLVANPSVTYNWYKYNNYTHIAVRSSTSRKIVGYFTLLPVTEELFEEIKSGVFKDNELETEGIRIYDIPDFYKLYVACVCVHPNYQNTTAFNKLYNSLIIMMYDLATEREVYITDIIAEASTPQGRKLCKILGLKKLMDTELATELYCGSLLPPSLRLNSKYGSKLVKFYQEKYIEMKNLF